MKTCLVALLSLAMTGTSGAFDQSAPYSPLRSGYDWSGAYIGGHVGYGWGGATNDWYDATKRSWELDGAIQYQNLTGGLQLGYQQQFGSVIAGLEADVSLANYRGDDSQFANRVNEIEITATGSLRGRVGWAADHRLLYGTTGIAMANFHKRDQNGLPNASQFAAGWVIGGGVEFAIAQNWAWRAEYLHTRLNDVETALSVNEPGFVGTYSHRANAPTINVLRIGANYRF